MAGASGQLLRVLFSGDLGRYDAPILPDPESPPACDFLVVESTYGDRTHPPDTAADALEREVLAAVARGGSIVMPAFAIGRTQEVLFLLRELEQKGRIPSLPVFVDSPMATDATPVYRAHREDHDLEMDALLDRGVEPLAPRQLRFTRTAEQSKAINRVQGPCIIVSASGMATGGRVLHHLAHRLPEPTTTILLVGFQAVGTRGWSLLNGAESVRIHGTDVPVRARVVTLPGFSAHGDRDEVTRWLDGVPGPPRRTFCVHGESSALAAQAARIAARGWEVHVPRHLETVELRSIRLLRGGRVLRLDGGMGTALIDRGLPADACPETWVIGRPWEVEAIHRRHVAAGAELLLTCTFNLARLDTVHPSLDPMDVAHRAVALARSARPALVAGCLGPTGSVERYEVACRALAAAGADLLWIETQIDPAEARSALAAGRRTGLPVVVTAFLVPGQGGMMALDGSPRRGVPPGTLA